VDTSRTVEDTDRAADALAEELAALGRPPRPGPAAPVETLLGGLAFGPEDGPRGLAPAALVTAAAEEGGLEMESLAARLRPRATRPWYRTAEEADPGAPATFLSVAVAAWALRRGAPDPPFLAAAAGSVARLTHTDAVARTDACLLALVAQEVALAPDRTDPAGAADRLVSLATRFGGAAPDRRLDGVWSAARRLGRGLRAAGAGSTGASGTAAALAGIGATVAPSPRAAMLRDALERVAGR
jgi:hypothetical protein